MEKKHTTRGIALLITLLIVSVLMGVSATLVNVSTRQFQLSGLARDSEMAFQAASAGMECIAYHDYKSYPDVSIFSVNGDGTPTTSEANIACAGEVSNDKKNTDGLVVSGEEQRFQYNWGSPEVCTDVSIYKFYDATAGSPMTGALGAGAADCPAGITCTVIRSRGYNVPCADITNARTLERELVERY